MSEEASGLLRRVCLASERLVEAHLRRQAEEAASLLPLHPLPPSYAMRARETPASPFSQMSVGFLPNCEVAARGTLAAVMAGVIQIFYPHTLEFFIIAVAILCEGRNVGETLQLARYSLLGSIMGVSIGWVCVAVGLIGPEEARRFTTLAAFFLVTMGIGYMRQPTVERKIFLATLVLGVRPPTPPLLLARAMERC